MQSSTLHLSAAITYSYPPSMKEIFIANHQVVFFCDDVFVIEALGGIHSGKANLRITLCSSQLVAVRVLLNLRNDKAVYRLIRQLSLQYKICFEDVSPSINQFIAKAEQWQQRKLLRQA